MCVQVTRDTLLSWVGLPYKTLCHRVLSLFISEDDLPSAALEAVIEDAFAPFVGEGGKTVPMVQLPTSGIHVAELWHGPTLAFKVLKLPS